MQAMVEIFKRDPHFEKLQNAIAAEDGSVHVWGLDKRIEPLLLEAVSKEENVRLIVTYDEKRAREIVDDYRFYDRNVYYYPAKDVLFYYADVHSNATVAERLEIFRGIAENRHITIVTTVEGLMDKIPPLHHMIDNTVTIHVNDCVEIGQLKSRLITLGYEHTTMVEARGQFSVRGGIIDIFPLTEECPYRIELWGDDVDSIRSFDVESQRSIEQVDSVNIYPACEMVLTEKRIQQGLDRIRKEHKKQAAKLKKEFRTEQYARLNKVVEAIEEELQLFNSTTGIDSLV